MLIDLHKYSNTCNLEFHFFSHYPVWVWLKFYLSYIRIRITHDNPLYTVGLGRVAYIYCQYKKNQYFHKIMNSVVVQPTFNRHTTLQNNNLNTYLLHRCLSALHVLNHVIIAKTIQGRYHNSWPTYKQESWGLKRVFVIWPMLWRSQNFHVGHQMLNTPSWLVCHYQIIIKILCIYLYIFPTMRV